MPTNELHSNLLAIKMGVVWFGLCFYTEIFLQLHREINFTWSDFDLCCFFFHSGEKKKKEKPRHLQAPEKGRSPQTSTLAVRSLVACCTNLDAVWSGVTPPPPPPLDLRPFHTTQWIISCETTSLDRPSGLFIGFNNLLKTEKKTKQTVKCFLTAVISRHGGLFTRLDVTIRGVAWPRMFTPLERRVALAENPPCCLHKEFLLQAVQQLQQYPVQETVVVVVVFCVFFCTSGGQLVLCHSRKYLCARFLSLSARLSRERW